MCQFEYKDSKTLVELIPFIYICITKSKTLSPTIEK